MSQAIIFDTGKMLEFKKGNLLPAFFVGLGGISLFRHQIEALKAAGVASVVLITRISMEQVYSVGLDLGFEDTSGIQIHVVNPNDIDTLKNILLERCVVFPSNMFFTEGFAKYVFELAVDGTIGDSNCFVWAGNRGAFIDSLKKGESLKAWDISGNHVSLDKEVGMAKCIKDANDVHEVEKYLYGRLMSSTDSLLTRVINRKISIFITRRISRLPVHPNHVTLFNFTLGTAAGLCVFMGTYIYICAGTILFLIASILDGCDGEIARLKYQRSTFGGLLDVVTDNIVHWMLFSGLTYSTVMKYGLIPYGVLGGALIFSSILAFVLSLTVVTSSAGNSAALGPTSVSKRGLLFSESRLSDLASSPAILDRMANRDFAYILVILALVGHPEWFLVLGGVGSPIFTYILYRSLRIRGVM